MADLDRIISKASDARDGGDRKAIKLRSASELEERGIACPYFYARLGIAYGVRQASYAYKNYKFASTTRAASQEKLIILAEEAAQKIDAVLSQYTPFEITDLTSPTGKFGHPIKPFNFHGDFQDTLGNYASISKAKEVLKTISQQAVQERGQYIKTGSPDVWLASFITAIGQLWNDLTGRKSAAKSEPFDEFLTSAYWALGGYRQQSWSRRIETSNNAIPSEKLLDIGYSIVPPHDLLSYEINSNEEIDPSHRVAIRRLLEDEDDTPEATAKCLCETGTLPRAIVALMNRVPWSPEAWAAAALGIPLDEAMASLDGIRFT